MKQRKVYALIKMDAQLEDQLKNARFTIKKAIPKGYALVEVDPLGWQGPTMLNIYLNERKTR